MKNELSGTRHKHAELIKAWADGAVIEWKSSVTGKWRVTNNPSWYEDMNYRIQDPLREIKEAYKRGENIEYKPKGYTYWNTVDRNYPIDSYAMFELRIKPKPKYVPFSFDDVNQLIGKPIKNKNSEQVHLIAEVLFDGIKVVGGFIPYGNLMTQYEFLDGSVIGNIHDNSNV